MFLLVLLIILICIFIIFTVFSSLAVYNYITNNVETSLTSDCIVATNNLIDITNLNCCFIAGNLTASKYVPELDMIVSPVIIPYEDVCNQFKNESKKNLCIEISKPKNCVQDSMPVAINGIVYYYPLAAGSDLCQDSRECV